MMANFTRVPTHEMILEKRHVQQLDANTAPYLFSLFFLFSVWRSYVQISQRDIRNVRDSTTEPVGVETPEIITRRGGGNN